MQKVIDGIQAGYLLRPADTVRLWKVAAFAAGIRGWLENNAGDTKAARASLREAHRRGELIDDDQLVAWARHMQAVVAVYAGDPATAEEYAHDGLRHLRWAGSRGRPLRAHILLGHIAEACANRGDLDGVERTIAEAHEIVTALPPEQRRPVNMILDEMTTVSIATFADDVGLAYARLGRPDHLEELTADARRVANRDGSDWRVFFRLNEALAVGRSADPDPERVAGLTREGLALAGPFQTAHAANRFGLILDAAKPFATHSAIRDLTEYSAAWQADRRAPSATDARL